MARALGLRWLGMTGALSRAAHAAAGRVQKRTQRAELLPAAPPGRAPGGWLLRGSWLRGRTLICRPRSSLSLSSSALATASTSRNSTYAYACRFGWGRGRVLAAELAAGCARGRQAAAERQQGGCGAACTAVCDTSGWLRVECLRR
jgi:hypothetical protein